MSVMLQGFEWNLPNKGDHFLYLRDQAAYLSEKGFTGVWLPPFYKGTSTFDVGYGVYDLYDLGEFDQKGSVRTKYGTKEDLLSLIDKLHSLKIQVYADVVLNHKAGADETEEFMAVQVDDNNRLETIGEPRNILGWTKFVFPGRKNQYSDFQWNFNYFNGVDYDEKTKTKGIFRILGENKDWSKAVSKEKGNFDYLMFANVDHEHPLVKEELFSWSEWIVKETGIDGFRFDAVKHIDSGFMDELVTHVRQVQGPDFYIFGEYWMADPRVTNNYLSYTEYDMDLFDVRLHFNMKEVSRNPEGTDLRKIFDSTIVSEHPQMAVTFVDNHDTQPGQSLESFIDSWFKKPAYGLILLRKDGYPCVFWGDYYGLQQEKEIPSFKEVINTLMQVRKEFDEASQEDHFIHEGLISWIRKKEDRGLVVLISTRKDEKISLSVGKEFAGKVFVDRTQSILEKVSIDNEGVGEFMVHKGDLSAWVTEK